MAILSNNSSISASKSIHKEKVTITTLLSDLSQKGRWELLLNKALQELRARHPDKDISIIYTEFPTNETRKRILDAMSNGTHVDLMSVDQIWLGELAEKGFLTDLTNFTQKWGRSSDWYQANWDGGSYKGRIYGIWAWTDVRGIWYWKDLLNEAKVDPNSLGTWTGYVDAGKKLNADLSSKGIQGTILFDTYYSQDLWYPYLWMLGGNILEQKEGHPTKGVYWFPAYNSTEGVKALQFISDQVNAGIKPEKFHGVSLDKEFADKKYAVMIGGSWIPGRFPQQQWPSLKGQLGFLPLFPIPAGENQTSTLMGGWELTIPKSSIHKDLAWELLTIILKPDLLGPWLEQYGYLPTQVPIGQGHLLNTTESSYPYYKEMISMIPIGGSRPSIPEYPQIAENIRVAIQEVYYHVKSPKQALDDAAAKSAKALGW
jgi:multiple sugar transport system substrate-binding protein